MDTQTPIREAVAMLGGQSALASAINATPAQVWQFLNGVRPIGAEKCAAIESATRGEVTCERLRPDLRWLRIADPAWPHRAGRPALDVSPDGSGSISDCQPSNREGV